ncbi:CDC27 family protein [Litoribacter populi]|uniref:CDC27 family protein n=1 Tax=Litoribacter populi TaxID=2598460 RepID=UPI00117FBFA1|nr:CDC27 family protein [Litoribacter populi]
MNQKFRILTLVLALCSANLFAQEQQPEPTDTNKVKNETDQRIYQMALRYNDVDVAKSKLYDLIARNPNNARYAEMLATMYFEMDQYASAALVAMDIIEANSKNVAALEIAAYSLEQLGALDRALGHFESLYLLSDDIFSLYKAANLQYSLKKYDEALNSLNMLSKNKKADEEKLAFPTKDNSQQEISMKAAAYNLKGLIYKDKGSSSEAKEAFNQALTFAPEFEVAKENIAELD